jgi:hypothetical protein
MIPADVLESQWVESTAKEFVAAVNQKKPSQSSDTDFIGLEDPPPRKPYFTYVLR